MKYRYAYPESASIIKPIYKNRIFLFLNASSIKNTDHKIKSGNKFDSNPHLLFIICHGQIAKKNNPINATFLFIFLFNN